MELEFQNATINPLNVTIGSFKHYYRAKLDFEKIEFQNRVISLISLENWALCCFFCPKRAFVNFVCINMCLQLLKRKCRLEKGQELYKRFHYLAMIN